MRAQIVCFLLSCSAFSSIIGCSAIYLRIMDVIFNLCYNIHNKRFLISDYFCTFDEKLSIFFDYGQRRNKSQENTHGGI